MWFFNLGRGEGEEGQVLQVRPRPSSASGQPRRCDCGSDRRARRVAQLEQSASPAAVPREECSSPPRPGWRLAPSPSPPTSLSSPALCGAGAGVRRKLAESLAGGLSRSSGAENQGRERRGTGLGGAGGSGGLSPGAPAAESASSADRSVASALPQRPQAAVSSVADH